MNVVFQGIQTKYMGPTNTKGARIKAIAPAGSITVPYDHCLSAEDAHLAAARALAEHLGWDDIAKIHQGSTPAGYCFVIEYKGYENA